MNKSETCDVVYHKYPSGHIEADDKPVAVAIAVTDAAIAPPLTPVEHPSNERSAKGGVMRVICRAPVLLGFHFANAVLGLAASIIVLVTLPLSIGLLPLGCVGAVLYQILAVAVRWMAKADIALVNLTTCGQKRLKVAFGIQSGFSTNIGRSGFASRLFFVSPKSLSVMFYLAIIKLAVGCLSLVLCECVIGAPAQIFATNGGAVTFGDGFTYDNHPTAYVLAFVGLWLLGVALLAPVWWLSVKLTTAFCAERDHEGVAAAASASAAVEIETPRGAVAKGANF